MNRKDHIITILLGIMSFGYCSVPTAYDQVVEYFANDSLKREAACVCENTRSIKSVGDVEAKYN